MGEKDFGGKFPAHGKSTGAETVKKSPPMPTEGKPKSKVDAGGKFPVTDGSKGGSK